MLWGGVLKITESFRYGERHVGQTDWHKYVLIRRVENTLRLWHRHYKVMQFAWGHTDKAHTQQAVSFSSSTLFDTVTRLRAVTSRAPFAGGARDFSHAQHVQTGRGAQPASNVYRGVFPLEVKRPGCEADHSPPPSVEVTNECSYTCPPPVCLHGLNRDNCTLLCSCVHMGSTLGGCREWKNVRDASCEKVMQLAGVLVLYVSLWSDTM
jgi:hypothetical protein